MVCKEYKSKFPGVQGAWEYIFDIIPDCQYCINKENCHKRKGVKKDAS